MERDINNKILTDTTCPVCGFESFDGSGCLGNYPLRKCIKCGLVYSPDAFFEKVDYTGIYDTPEYISSHLDTLERMSVSDFKRIVTFAPFFEHLSKPRGRKLLDVGCGVGRFGRAAANEGWDVTGIDISARAVEIGSQNAGFPMLNKSLEEIRDEGHKYDVLTSFEVLEHLKTPVEFLRTCFDVLAPDGEIFLTVPNWDCPEVQNSTEKDCVPPVHLLYFTVGSLQSAVERAGFRVLHCGIIHSYPTVKIFKPRTAAGWVSGKLKGLRNSPIGLYIHAAGRQV